MNASTAQNEVKCCFTVKDVQSFETRNEFSKQYFVHDFQKTEILSTNEFLAVTISKKWGRISPAV